MRAFSSPVARSILLRRCSPRLPTVQPSPLRRAATPSSLRRLPTARRLSAASDGRLRPMEEGEGARSGEIHVIVGPMFAGKTTALLHRMQAEAGCGRIVTVVKSSKDTRYGLDSIVTHDGIRMTCHALSELLNLRDKLGAHAYDKVEVIGIDEAQFFEDLHDFCHRAADQDGKTVIVAGLDGDYQRKKFGSVLDIIPLADSVTKLSARCQLCGGRAFFTLRKTKETQTELIGGADMYMPVCRQHYIGGQIIKKATNIVLDIEGSKIIQSLI